MTVNTIIQTLREYETIPSGSTGRWYVATDALEGTTIEDIRAQNKTGALILATRKGFWIGNLNKPEVELFLWGTSDQLDAAQRAFKLQPAADALLDRPELYWG